MFIYSSILIATYFSTNCGVIVSFIPSFFSDLFCSIDSVGICATVGPCRIRGFTRSGFSAFAGNVGNGRSSRSMGSSFSTTFPRSNVTHVLSALAVDTFPCRTYATVAWRISSPDVDWHTPNAREQCQWNKADNKRIELKWKIMSYEELTFYLTLKIIPATTCSLTLSLNCILFWMNSKDVPNTEKVVVHSIYFARLECELHFSSYL